MDRSHYSTHKRGLHDRSDDDGFVPGTAKERILMMWPLAQDAWLMMGEEGRRKTDFGMDRSIVHAFRRVKLADTTELVPFDRKHGNP